jgi:hypothetical protein
VVFANIGDLGVGHVWGSGCRGIDPGGHNIQCAARSGNRDLRESTAAAAVARKRDPTRPTLVSPEN